MNKLEVGIYVRTKLGIKQIYKIDNNKTKWKYLYKLKKQDGDGCVDCGILCDEDIFKSSHNTIDLIEVGDYVNGYLVIEKPYTYHDIQFVSVDTQDSWSWGKGEMPVENIKTIVTKEQFKNMEYRLGE